MMKSEKGSFILSVLNELRYYHVLNKATAKRRGAREHYP